MNDRHAAREEARREHPSAYFVQDRSNAAELTRLHLQDEMLTTSMGGVLPEQPDPTRFHRVLDAGCGTGGWLIEMARTYPSIHKLIGIDVSSRMVAYAREQAQTAGVGDRVRFHCGDVLRRIDFPAGFFDLANQRLGMSYLRVWEWPKIVQEYQRVTRPGGIIRITEASTTTENNSAAFTRIASIAHQAQMRAGHLFTSQSDGVIAPLADLLRLYGIANVQTRAYRLIYRGGTSQGERFAQDMATLFHVGFPFLNKWTRVPEDYQALCQQAIKEMHLPDFEATWSFLTAWGWNRSHEHDF